MRYYHIVLSYHPIQAIAGLCRTINNIYLS